MKTKKNTIAMKPSHPGEFIRQEIIEELNLSITRSAEILGFRRATLSDVLNQKRSLSPEMALRIEKAFNVSMDGLLKMQAWYDTYTMRKRSAEIDVQPYTDSVNR